MTEIAVEESKGYGKVVVHVGAAADQDAFTLARHAAAVGADALSSLPKFVDGGHSFDDNIAFYRTLGALTDLPVLAYYIPQVRRTRRDVGVAGAARRARDCGAWSSRSQALRGTMVGLLALAPIKGMVCVRMCCLPSTRYGVVGHEPEHEHGTTHDTPLHSRRGRSQVQRAGHLHDPSEWVRSVISGSLQQ
jgi:hypothetical protein